MNKILRTAGVILMSFFLTFGATPTKATDAVSGYISRYTVSTGGRSDWKGSEGTTVSSNSVERNGKNVISFSSGRGSSVLGASYSTDSMPTVDFDVSTLTFKFLLYIDDVSAIKDRNGDFLGGEIGFYGKKVYLVQNSVDGQDSADVSETSFAEEAVFYKWDLSDLNLKQGWNRLTLNFKIAETDKVINSFTFEGITEFRIVMNKNTSSDLTVAMDNAEVCFLSISEDGKVIEPITDTQNVKELALAAGVAALVVGGLTAGCYIWAKKDEKRRLMARRAKIMARKQSQKNDE